MVIVGCVSGEKKSPMFLVAEFFEQCVCIYRVAQNKIPHQTICNIFATSDQILKILEAV